MNNKILEFPLCTLCFHELVSDLVVPPCRHVIHNKCYQSLIENCRSECPTCRQTIPIQLKPIFYEIKGYDAIDRHYYSSDLTSRENLLSLNMKLNQMEKKLIKYETERKEKCKEMNAAILQAKKSSEDFFHSVKHSFSSLLKLKSIEAEAERLKKRVLEISEENNKIRKAYEMNNRENNFLKERINIFENHSNISEIEEYVNGLNSNGNVTIEERNIILSDLVKSLVVKMRGEKKIVVNLNKNKQNKVELIDLVKVNDYEDIDADTTSIHRLPRQRGFSNHILNETIDLVTKTNNTFNSQLSGTSSKRKTNQIGDLITEYNRNYFSENLIRRKFIEDMNKSHKSTIYQPLTSSVKLNEDKRANTSQVLLRNYPTSKGIPKTEYVQDIISQTLTISACPPSKMLNRKIGRVFSVIRDPPKIKKEQITIDEIFKRRDK